MQTMFLYHQNLSLSMHLSENPIHPPMFLTQQIKKTPFFGIQSSNLTFPTGITSKLLTFTSKCGMIIPHQTNLQFP
jgi:hypothetical protein